MNRAEFDAKVAEVVAALFLGEPSAAKRGRNPAWPYVPVVDFTREGMTGPHATRTEQLKGFAFQTREAAVEFARGHIAGRRLSLAASLKMPRMRALRRHHGLPEEIPE